MTNNNKRLATALTTTITLLPWTTNSKPIFRLFLAFFAAVIAAPTYAQISDDEIRVGLLLDMKSIYSHFSGRGSVVAAEMAIKDAGGQINGKPIKLVHADHGNKPTTAANISRQWLYKEGIDVIADVVGSPEALAVQEVNREKGAVLLFNAVMSSAVTGKKCAPTGIHWMYNGDAFNNVIGRTLTRSGKDKWFFVTVDNAFGNNVERSLSEVIKVNGGTVLGSVRHPFKTSQIFSELRQASASGAEVIALVSAGNDLINAARQSFDLLSVSKGKTILTAVATTINDVHRMTLPLTQGMHLSHSFYWNLDAQTRAWSMRFYQRTGTMPSDMQAGVYSSLTHYFKAVAASNSDHGKTVVKKMHELPIRDPIVRNASLRPDGRMVHDIYLLRVKKPSESKEPWDYLEVVETIPGYEAFPPIAESQCVLK